MISWSQLDQEGAHMDVARRLRPVSVSRREALALAGALAAIGGTWGGEEAGAAEAGILQPVSLDHVNIRVSNVARSADFYMGLFDTPVLRSAALRARPDSPPSEAYFLRFGEGYLAISQAHAPDSPGLDHYSVGLRDYDQAKMAAKLRDSGYAAEPRGAADIWVRDLDGNYVQLRAPGGWARQTAVPFAGSFRAGPALSPGAMSRIALRTAELARAGEFYGRLFGTESASPTSGRSRAFSIGDAVLELVAVAADSAPSGRLGMDHIRIAIKDVSAETVGRFLRERGIETRAAAQGAVRIADPDGIRIELAAAK
jgi:catechol 2,3-dioxygenase-like lactoylglutathione lyase family enzyme